MNQRAFEAALGEFFVYRELRRDFGVDGEVEIFDGDNTTGLTFDVQLRATDAADTRRARRVRVSSGHVEYWRSRQGPMLVVRYLGSTGQLYARWLHSFDSYRDGEPSAKTLPLPMRDEDLLDDARRDRLAAEVAAYRRLQQAALQRPITMRISNETLRVSHAELLVALRKANHTPDLINVDSAEGQAEDIRFRVADEQLAVDLAGVTGAMLHVDSIEDLGADVLSRNLLALSALAFERIGQSSVTGRLAHIYLADSILADNADAVMAIASAMAHARQIREALELAEALDQRGGEAAEHSAGMMLVALVHASSLSPAESDLHVATLRARLQRRISGGDRASAAMVAVTLGNAFGHRQEHGKALAAFDKALRLDPGYANRAHFHQKRAGALFLAGRYAESTDAYARARELGAPHFTAALHADAQLYAGRYEEAEFALVAYLVDEDDQIRASEYILKRVLCAELAARGITRQVRRTSDAAKVAGRAAQATSPEAARDLAEAALTADAVSPLPWFNLGIALRELEDPAAATAFLCAALIYQGDPEVWAEALLIPGADHELSMFMLLTARRMTDGAVFETMATVARKHDKMDFLAELPGLIGSLPHEEDRPITVRGISVDGVESIRIR